MSRVGLDESEESIKREKIW